MVKATPTPVIEKIEPIEKTPEPEPEPEPEPVQKREEPIVQPIIEKEKIADPTKKEKKEVKKEIKKTPKKIIQKPKVKKKEKPKKQQKHKKQHKQEKRQGYKNINSKDNINSQASATHAATTNNPNLIGTGKNKDLLAAYKSAIRRAIERNKRYPNRAKLMRKQGIVTVSFHINKNGNLINIHIQKSSNNKDLDKAALKAVKQVSGMGPPPAGIPLKLSIPIQFKIH